VKTISEAIVEIGELGQDDVTITVAPGVYTDNVSINTSANPVPVGITRKPLKLTIASSSTAAATIINSNGAGPVFTIGPDTKVQLDGFTITNGAGVTDMLWPFEDIVRIVDEWERKQ
jgi:pectin methylesterase-like acyl-CoA thioesterase